MTMPSESASAPTPESGRWRDTTGRRSAKGSVGFIKALGKKFVVPSKQTAPPHAAHSRRLNQPAHTRFDESSRHSRVSLWGLGKYLLRQSDVQRGEECVVVG